MSGYRQFCPVAKGAEIIATRWTALILRELMFGETSFNDIHRGVPLMSRTLLAERLRQLEQDGIIARVVRGDTAGHDYRLTPAGDALRVVVDSIGRWGLIYGRDRIQAGDRDASVLMWALRRRVDRTLLPRRRAVVRFQLSGVPRSRRGVRQYWLVLERSGVDVCQKDPGFPVDVTVSGDVAKLIAVYLGYMSWSEATRQSLRLEGDREVSRNLGAWLRLDLVVGRDLPVVPPAAMVSRRRGTASAAAG